MRYLLLAVALFFPAGVAADGGAQPRALPLVFHVAETAEGPVVDERFLESRLAGANRVFGPYGVKFERVDRVVLAPEHLHMQTRADRHALGAYVRPEVINCFVVQSLRDVDEPERMRRGVHWRSQTHHGKRYVILSSIAGEYVLAHELGHYLGNHKHSDVAGNLMSYSRGQGVPFLDADQLANLRRALSRLK